MQQEKPDLVVSDILATAAPTRKLILNVAQMSSSVLTLLEALDIAEASGFDAVEFAAVLRRGSLRDKARLMYAFAWVVARRIEPDLTYEEVCTYQLEVVGAAPDSKKASEKAKAIVAVASLAGVSPNEAKQMTIDEVAAVSDLHKRRSRRATTPRRRKAS